MPPVVLERPKMSRPMWDALKIHIMRERQRKKQELEADAEEQRQRKERERQQKQHVLTLSETREQISSSETRLSELKEEKHQLFLQLKKVLNEDEIRKRQIMSQEANDLLRFQHQYSYSNPPRIQLVHDQSGAHHLPTQTFMQPIQLSRAPVAQVFKVGGGHPGHPSIQQGSGGGMHQQHPPTMPITIKRTRSPSPPPPHNYRFGPFKPPPQAIPQYAHQKPSMSGLQYFHPPGSQQTPPQAPSPHSSPQQQHSVSFSSVPHPSQQQQNPSLYTSYSNAPPSRSPQQQQQVVPREREESQKHVQAGPMFIHHGAPLPRGYVIHQAVEHTRSSPHKFHDDGPKYYPPPTHGLGLRTGTPSHLSIHPGITIQQNPNVPSGGITSGYPIRTQPNAAYQGRPPSPQVAYSIPGGPPRLTYGHPHGQIPQHPGIRYSLPPGAQRD